MAMVEFTWTMNIPNEFMVDHTFTDGKTVQKVYDGPDKLFLIIGKNELDSNEWEIAPENTLFCSAKRISPKLGIIIEIKKYVRDTPKKKKKSISITGLFLCNATFQLFALASWISSISINFLTNGKDPITINESAAKPGLLSKTR